MGATRREGEWRREGEPATGTFALTFQQHPILPANTERNAPRPLTRPPRGMKERKGGRVGVWARDGDRVRLWRSRGKAGPPGRMCGAGRHCRRRATRIYRLAIRRPWLRLAGGHAARALASPPSVCVLTCAARAELCGSIRRAFRFRVGFQLSGVTSECRWRPAESRGTLMRGRSRALPGGQGDDAEGAVTQRVESERGPAVGEQVKKCIDNSDEDDYHDRGMGPGWEGDGLTGQ
jgi:hypothetical protein